MSYYQHVMSQYKNECKFIVDNIETALRFLVLLKSWASTTANVACHDFSAFEESRYFLNLCVINPFPVPILFIGQEVNKVNVNE